MNHLSPGKPEQAGMDARILDQACDLLQSEIEARRITAAVLLVARNGLVVTHRGFGHLWPKPGSPETQPDSRTASAHPSWTEIEPGQNMKRATLQA